MPRFAVWAPRPTTVELVLDGRRRPMERAGRGWWHGTEAAVAGARYAFSLDGGPPRPDPRSASQPDGVHGASAVVDHGSFRWSDDGWRGVSWRGAISYEMHIGTFSAEGTFDGAVAHLPHLVDLGVDLVELMPVAEFPGRRGWGYDGVDLYAPHHGYGGPDGLKRFVDACHAHGLGVVLDVVYNHFGPAGNYLPEFGPYQSDDRRTVWGEAVNFDGPGSDEVRHFVIDNALMWLQDYHFDGLRLDAVHAIIDTSPLHILEELAVAVDAAATRVGRPLFLVAENDSNDPRLVRSRDAGGYGLDAAWADEWHHAVHATLTGERSGYYQDFGPLATLAKALQRAWVGDGAWSHHRQRRHGRPATGLSGHQFVIATQNHDQVGNRAQGERTSALVDDARLRVAAALLATSPFSPLLFQGQEWGATTPFNYFTDHREPELARKVRDGRRREFADFGWDPDDVPDPQAAETFERSKLDWTEPIRPGHARMLGWYRQLLALRRTEPGLADPRLEGIGVDFDEQRRVLRIERPGVVVLVNLGDAPHRFPVDDDATVAAASEPGIDVVSGAATVPAIAVAIVIQGGDRR